MVRGAFATTAVAGVLAAAACNVIAGIDAGEPACPVDGDHNGLETGIDCGGPCDDACPPGAGCETGDDCQEGVCIGGHCAPAQCNDGVRNGGESDVDCGDGDCDPCFSGEACREWLDCLSLTVLDEGACSIAGVCLATCCAGDCAGCGSCPEQCPPQGPNADCDPTLMEPCFAPLECIPLAPMVFRCCLEEPGIFLCG